ncbi:MAG: PPC domain-containing protein [Oculatellaceae cyanobacterium Prado106]|jgi:hypothetical protein|nr:PPC domain-containing protein [Oculatellaceae cyanobacterium Prado106]
MLNHAFDRTTTARASDNRPGGALNVGALNGTRKFRGAVGVNDKIDFYSFTLTGRSSFNLALNKLKNNVDVFLQQGNRIVARSTKGGRKSEAIATTLEAGTYFVRVNQKSGNSKYRLTLNASPLSTPNPTPTPNPNPTPGSRRLVSLLESGTSTESRIGFVDLSTGNVSRLPLGNLGNTVIRDIATFGNDTFAVANPNNLYKIDTSTSTYTLISSLVPISKTDVNSLGFTSSGELYAAATKGEFYRINTTTGQASLIATIPGFSASGDIAYDPVSSRFFAVSRSNVNGVSDSLYSIGLSGDARLIGNIGFSQIWGLAYENGTLYGFTPQQQIKIDAVTGAGTVDKPITPINTAISGAA